MLSSSSLLPCWRESHTRFQVFSDFSSCLPRVEPSAPIRELQALSSVPATSSRQQELLLPVLHWVNWGWENCSPALLSRTLPLQSRVGLLGIFHFSLPIAHPSKRIMIRIAAILLLMVGTTVSPLLSKGSRRAYVQSISKASSIS